MVKEKDQITENLERRIDDFAQYSRINNLIIQGLDTKHRIYARTVATDRRG